MTRYTIHFLVLTLLASGSPSFAQEFKSGDITIEKPWAPATPKGAEVGAGYLTIRNSGAAPDRLTGGATDFATIEIHEMTMENGVMRMPQLKNGLPIPARGLCVSHRAAIT